ncbi:metal ABC transporter ATP-binding protein [Kineococcus glutinatus]|uniref:Metal ABC transporter ATP-binding protein n=1 Tax=Kineococcus glutinatus TaxID=1070872 RepID=A0ABP9HLB9_9ACTN
MSAPVVDVQDVTVRYGDVLALERASLRLGRGAVCGLVGMNGSGKSSLLKAVTGLVRPESGRVLVQGAPPLRARRAQALAYVPQGEDVDWTFPVSVREVVMMGRHGHQGPTRRPRRRDTEAVDSALERVGLTELAGRQIGALSGGQRKRAFVARGIAQEAALLLLDEPFAGVDKRSEATISALLAELAAEGRTVLISTHDLHALPQLCTEAVLLARRVLLHDTPAEVLRPENLALAFGLDVLGRTPATGALT